MIPFPKTPTLLAAITLLAPSATKAENVENPAKAGCDLKITSATFVDSKGKAHNPKFGETYNLKVTWSVTGKPKAAYSILFKVAGETYKWTGLKSGAGTGYTGMTGFNLELDGEIPFSVTLDPDKTSGDTKTTNNIIKGTLKPTPPSIALEYFNPVARQAVESCAIAWNIGGTVSTGYLLFGQPVTSSFQTVNSAIGPQPNVTENSTPTGDPVWKSVRNSFTPAVGNQVWPGQSVFNVTVSGARTSIAKLRAVTWAKETGFPATVTPYLAPNTWVQSTDPAITAFVKTILPANYKTTMTPYDAAKKIYMAVVKRTVYETPAIQDAKTTLSIKKGDCGSFTNLCSACFRSIGIPSRSNSGFWVGTNQWHVNGEFYLQGIGWIPFDPSESRLFDTSGTYPYFFGSIAALNQFCAVSRGEDHRMGADQTTTTQVGQLFFTGTATYLPYQSIAVMK